MGSTVIFGGFFAALIAVQVLASAWCLRWGARWVKREPVSLGSTLLVVLLNRFAQLVITACAYWIPFSDDRLGRFMALQVVASCMVVPVVLTSVILRLGLVEALLAWLPALLPAAALALFSGYVAKPYIVEAYKCSTNSMAPTLLGAHFEAACPNCGSPAYGSPQKFDAGEASLMICSKEWTAVPVRQRPQQVLPADRVLVAKFLKPRRWDLLVFRYPENPNVCHVMRVIGLPGEEVQIHDGTAWINGQRLVPPESLHRLNYTDHLDGFPVLIWGSVRYPAKLAADEYFVLGDFSPRANDSRLWQVGAPGHAPYAVPASHIVGVVTHCYWPPQRTRIFR